MEEEGEMMEGELGGKAESCVLSFFRARVAFWRSVNVL